MTETKPAPKPEPPKTIDAYLEVFPPDVRARLEVMRATIRAAAPEAVEKIAYGIPTFTLAGKNLVHFAGYAKHVGFYPAPSGLTAFAEPLSGYKGSKGAVQFPHTEALPLALVEAITRFRVGEIRGT
jgi:uncharacterized protein YdhG (YjbR/CyaY superfamily)